MTGSSVPEAARAAATYEAAYGVAYVQSHRPSVAHRAALGAVVAAAVAEAREELTYKEGLYVGVIEDLSARLEWAVAEERATTGQRIEAARREGFEQGLRDAADVAGSGGAVFIAASIRAGADRVRAALASPGEGS